MVVVVNVPPGPVAVMTMPATGVITPVLAKPSVSLSIHTRSPNWAGITGVLVAVGVGELVAVLVGVGDGVLVAVGVGVGELIAVLVGVGDGVLVAVGVGVGELVAVLVGVGDGVLVAVLVGVGDGVLVAVGVGDGVGVAVGAVFVIATAPVAGLVKPKSSPWLFWPAPPVV